MRTAELRPPITPSDQLGIADKLAFLACYSRYFLSVSAENYPHLAQLLSQELEGVTPLSVLHFDDLRKFEPGLLVANGFGLREVSPGSNTALEVIGGLVEDSAVRPLVIVEGADKVSDEKLRQLFILVERLGLGLALFTDRSLVKRKAVAQFDSQIFHTTVSKLSTSDVRQMVRRRAAMDAKLSEMEIEDLASRSEGQMDRLDGLIEDMIEIRGRKLGLPLVHMSGLVVLAIVLVGGWLTIESDETTMIPVALENRALVDSESSSELKVPEYDAPAELSEADVSTTAPIQKAAEHITPMTADEASPVSQQTVQALPAEENERSAASTSMSTSRSTSRSTSMANSIPETVVTRSTSALTQSVRDGAPVPLDNIDPNAWVNKLPATAAGSSRQQSQPSEPQKAWLQNAPDTAYTLQLMGSYSEDRVLSFIAEQGNGHEFGYFKTTHRNQPWFVLTLGQYPGREQALQAIDLLPPQLRAQKPWARNVASIRGH